jgi:hypothetical protein
MPDLHPEFFLDSIRARAREGCRSGWRRRGRETMKLWIRNISAGIGSTVAVIIWVVLLINFNSYSGIQTA